MEAFSDGVIAIIITIMVLELHVPHEANLAALRPLAPVLISYLLSFIYIGIYWSNHHHLLHAANHVDGRILWANLHLLFWLSLVPFVTAWMGENHFDRVPVAVYGVVLFSASIAYLILTQALIALHGRTSKLAIAVGRDFKGLISTSIYAVAIPLSLARGWLGFVLYVVVAIMWLVPDRRIERALTE
jgi:TMEM175 potassium channel family protein